MSFRFIYRLGGLCLCVVRVVITIVRVLRVCLGLV